jgi:RNA polymerase II subunit A small phosphatase-like protein
MLGPSDSGRILLILDLDETLIHAREAPLDRKADFVLYGYHIYRRPFLDEFIATCAEHFDLAVWSSASDDYVKKVVEQIFPDPQALRFVWGRSRATLRRAIADEFGYSEYSLGHMNYLKPLHKVARKGWDLRRVLIVDDSPEKLVRNYGNAIYPAAYEGHAEDRELEVLARYLKTLRDCQNVRSVEKRTWRSSISVD